jgi:hypothetical protein
LTPPDFCLSEKMEYFSIGGTQPIHIGTDFGQQEKFIQFRQWFDISEQSFIAHFRFGVEVDKKNRHAFELADSPTIAAQPFGPDDKIEFFANFQKRRYFIFYVQISTPTQAGQ